MTQAEKRPSIPLNIVAFTLGLLCALLCYMAAGHSLGFYIGGIAAAALLVPPITAAQERPLDALLAAGSIIDGVGMVWLGAAVMTSVTFGQWLAAYLVLAAFGAALFAIVLLLRPVLGATLASAFAVIIALLWLSWPVLLSPWLGGRVGAAIVAWLTPAHPLLAINRTFIDMGVWLEQRLIYQRTSLGQDVPYALPASVAPCVLLHGFIALALAWPAWWARPGESAERPSAESPAS